MFATPLFVLLQAAMLAAPVDTSGMRLLGHDDGKMEERFKLNLSGATVEFTTDGPRELTGVQFFGSRYATDAKPTDSFIVTISDESFRAMRRIDKPLTNISPGHDTWQTISIEPEMSVSGKFYVSLIHDSTPAKGVFVGLDNSDPGEFSKTGVPGTVPTTVDPKVNYMIRAVTAPPGTVAAVRAPRPKPTAVARPVAAKPTPAGKPATTKPALTPFTRPAGASNGLIAYRNPNRQLSMRAKAPALPRGSGRVDVTWDIAPPVKVTLQYAGYGPKKPPVTAGEFNSKRIVVDFPVPEPAQFNVTVEKPGFQPASKTFRVVRGSNQGWRAVLTPGSGTVAPEPMATPRPEIMDEPRLPANPLPSGISRDESSTGLGGNMSQPDQPAVPPGEQPVVPSLDAPAPLPSVDDPAVRANRAPRTRVPRTANPDGSRFAPAERGNNAPNGAATPDARNRRPRTRPGVAPPPAPGAPASPAPEAPEPEPEDAPPPPEL